MIVLEWTCTARSRLSPSTRLGASSRLGRSSYAAELIGWSASDCRGGCGRWRTAAAERGLERTLHGSGEPLVRVPPRLTAPERRTGRAAASPTRSTRRGCESGATGAAAWIAAAGEAATRELKLLVDHRDDLVDERTAGHTAALAPARARSRADEPRLARLTARSGSTGSPRRSSRKADRAGADRTRARRSLPHTDPHDPRPRPRAPGTDRADRPGAARAPWLRSAQRRQAARRDRPDRTLRLDAQLARHAAVAPLEASSGNHQRHRLDRGGNRQLNCALHRIAITQARMHPPARAYLERKQSEGKSRREALRCLKRQLARTVYTTLRNEPLLT